MLFNKNVVKRISSMIGITRTSKKTVPVINEIATARLQRLLNQLTHITLYSKCKTVSIQDVKFALQLSGVQLIGVDKVKLYLQKKTFDMYLRDLARDSGVRFEKGVVILLQHLVEEYIIRVIKGAALCVANSSRSTLLVQDIKSALNIIKIQGNGTALLF